MLRNPRRSCPMFLGLLAAVVLFVGSGPPMSECEEARLWVDANLDRLPTRLEDFSAYSMTYRKAIYRALPAERREGLWSAHLGNMATAFANGTPERTFFDDVRSRLGDYLSMAAGDPSLTELTEHAIEVLGRENAREALVVLGGPKVRADGTPQPLADCTCSQGNDWCPINFDCAASACEFQLFGCGTLLLFACDGDCRWAPS